MTALAIGPPSRPPAMSPGAVLLDCTSTATATLGSSAGAKEVNQAYGGRESVDSAVPVLPATRTPGIAAGEACFTTASAGYEQAVTDPSYARQVLAFASPLVGNYGVDETRLESDRVWTEGVVMRRARPAWSMWLAQRGVVALEEVDTRVLALEQVRKLQARQVDWYRTGLVGGVIVAAIVAAVLSQTAGGGGGPDGPGPCGPRPCP